MTTKSAKNRALDIYQLSPLQEGMLYHHLYHEGGADHVTQGDLEIQGDMSASLLERAFQHLVDRHDVLRTVFLHDETRKPRQVVVESRKARVRFYDLCNPQDAGWTLNASGVGAARECAPDADRALEAIACADRETAFDLKRDLLVRMTLVRTSPRSYHLLITNHHIVLDGWSLSLLLEELIECYAAEKARRAPQLGRPVQFKRYIKWMASLDHDAGYDYFRRHTDGFGNITGIAREDCYFSPPTGAGDPAGAATERFARLEYPFDQGLSDQLARLCSEHNLTMNTLMQGLWALVLHCYSGRDDLVFGNVVSGRNPAVAGVEAMVGLMINTLPLRVRLQKTALIQQLAALQRNAKHLETYCFLQLAEIQKQVRGNQPLFDHILTIENFPADETPFESRYHDIGFTLGGRHGRDSTSFDLDVSFFPQERLMLRIIYRLGVYADDVIQAVGATLQRLAEQLVQAPTLRCDECTWCETGPEAELSADTCRNLYFLEPSWKAALLSECQSRSPSPVRLRVLDSGGRWLPAGALGTVWRLDSDSDGWSATSFLGRVRTPDSHPGVIEIVSDTRRHFNHGDFCADPCVVERIARLHPAVGDCVALMLPAQPGVESQGGGQLVVIATPRAGGVETVSSQEVLALLSGRLPRYLVPREVLVCEHIPRSGDAVDQAAVRAMLKRSRSLPDGGREDEFEQQLRALWCESLQVQEVRAGDDFFECGGHSLAAVRLVAKVKRTFGCELGFTDLFTLRSFSAIAAKIRNAVSAAEQAQSPSARADYVAVPIPPAPAQPFYRTSSQQQRLYTLQALERSSTAYNMPDAFAIRGALDVERLAQAFQLCADKHESLRTSFQLHGDAVVQRIHDQIPAALERIRCDAADFDLAAALEDFVRPFDLSTPRLFRARLIELGERDHILLIDMHHIITDGVSIDTLVEDLMGAYRDQALTPATMQYRDFSEWQRSAAVKEALTDQEAYWLSRFSGEIPVLNLPTDHVRAPVFHYRAAQCQISLGQTLSERIPDFCQRRGITPYMFFLAVYQVLLARYTGQQAIVVGVPVAGRNHPETDRCVGPFVNTLVINQTVLPGERFEAHLDSVRDTVLGALDHQNYPLEELLEKLAPVRDVSRNALFDVMFVMEERQQPIPALPGLEFEVLPGANQYAKVDLLLAVLNDAADYGVHLEYARELFETATMTRFAEHYRTLAQAVVDSPEQTLGAIELLGIEEQAQLLYDFNATTTGLPAFANICEQFQAMARRCADAAAVVCDSRVLSYRELDLCSDRIAARLQQHGCGKGQVVALMMARSAEAIAAVMGVLKAGAAYVPVGADYSRDRLQLIIDELASPLLLCSEALCAAVDTLALPCTMGVIEHWCAPAADTGEFRSPEMQAGDLAYVIYTSGSTGAPKGIDIEHRSVLNLALYFGKFFSVGDAVTQFAPFTFDASAGEIFTTLLNGATLHVLTSECINNPQHFARYLGDRKINFCALPPPYLAHVDFSAARELRTLLAAGSSSNPDIIASLRERFTYVNAYGPTETTVVSTEWISAQDPAVKNNIGRPIVNTEVVVLNESGRLQPVGVEGEICIGGLGLARGYVNDPEKTRRQFIAHPYRAGARLYRTGDIGRITPDGYLIFLGRRDDQVKIRGFRIEIAEVEHHVKTLSGVEDVLVIAREDEQGALALCCYFTLTDGIDPERFDTDPFRQRLAEIMPAYMIPAYLIPLTHWPLTVNGKIDRSALPDPNVYALQHRDRHVAPANELEALLVDSWEQVLGCRDIGTTDNFFTLGGDSIKAIQISARLSSQGYHLEVRHLFQHPRIKELASCVERRELMAEQGKVTGRYPFTPIQHWFVGQDFSARHHWNQSTLLYSGAGFDAVQVEQTLAQLLEHHDNLRARIDFAGAEVEVPETVQEPVRCHVYPATADALDAQLQRLGNALQSSMDLGISPLVRTGILRTPEGDYLLLAVHHFLVDAVSWRILFEDFCEVYGALVNRQTVNLPPKSHAFSRWAQALPDFAQSNVIRRQLPYWQRVVRREGLGQLVDEPSWKPGALRDVGNFTVELDARLTRQFLAEVHRAFNTRANDILLAALALAVAQQWGEGDWLINLEGHGREDIGEALDVARTVGWFTCAFPVRLRCVADDLADLVCRTKENLHRVPGNGLGYGLLRYLDRDGGETLSQGARPHISFNYLGEFSFPEASAAICVSGRPTGMDASPDNEVNCPLDINGSVFEGRLSLSLDFDGRSLDPASVEALAAGLRRSLERLIEFCCARSDATATPSDYAAEDLSQADLDEIRRLHEGLGGVEDIHNLTPLQEGMLYSNALNQGRGDYNIQNSIQLKGPVDSRQLQRAFQKLAGRHQALRTAVLHERLDKPRQVILRQREIPFTCLDISDLASVARQRYVDDFLAEDWKRGFDLSTDSLTRVALIKLEEHRFELIMLSHHIMMDGWCIGAVFAELMAIYSAGVRGEAPTLDPAPAYSDYLHWLQARDRLAAREFWRDYQRGMEGGSLIPFFKPGRRDHYQLEEHEVVIASEPAARLQRLAARHGVTLNSVMQSVWALVLSSYNDSDEVIFANVISGRPTDLPGADQTIGLFVNTIPLRIGISDQPFCDFVQKVQQSFKEAESYGYLGLAEILELGAVPAKLIDHVFVFENYPVGAVAQELRFSGLDMETGAGREQVNYDFNLIVVPGDPLRIRLSFNAAAIEPQQVEQIGQHISTVVMQLSRSFEQPCAGISIISGRDEQCWAALNATARVYPAGRTVLDDILAQVQKRPDNRALVSADGNLTYKELWARAGAVAGLLAERRHAGRQAPVAISLLRGEHMMTAVLGILRAGAAYLPIDPQLPRERIDYMLDNAGVKRVLVDTAGARALAHREDLKLIELDQPDTQPQATLGGAAMDLPAVGIDQLAYVLYTSGSTGKPKGVMIEHGAIFNRLAWMIEHYGFSADDVFLQKTTFTFDVSVFELLLPFMCGATLVVPAPGVEKQPDHLLHLIQAQQVSVIHFVPSMLSGFLQVLDESTEAPSLRLCVCSGEPLTTAQRDQLFARLPHVGLSNLYGPTEAAIDVTFSDVSAHDPVIAIGRPVANTRCYVLDRLGRLAPVGVTGELCLAGVQLARGYINQDALTAEKFVPCALPGETRIYRTGDLARLGGDGQIYYVGRLDFQVKVRGHRIETGEVEAVLARVAEIREVLVSALVLADGTNALCAYFSAGTEISTEVLKTILAAQLPDYMIPAFFVQLPAFPLTASGKINRRQLPWPAGFGPEDTVAGLIAPATDLELAVASAWVEVLKPDGSGPADVSVVQRFDEMGGHSISAMRIVAILSRNLRVKVNVHDLYAHPSIRELAAYLEKVLTLRNAPSEPPVSAEASVPAEACGKSFDAVALSELVLAQCHAFEARLVGQQGDRTPAYSFPLSSVQALHRPSANRLSGGLIALDHCPDSAALAQAARDVICEQELLTSALRQVDGNHWVWNCYSMPAEVQLPSVDLSGLGTDAEQIAIDTLAGQVSLHIQRRLAAHVGTHQEERRVHLPYAMVLVKRSQGRHLLMFAADHLITDAASIGVLQQRLLHHYHRWVSADGEHRRRNVQENGAAYSDYVKLLARGPGAEVAQWQTRFRDYRQQHVRWLDFYHRHSQPTVSSYRFQCQFNPAQHSPVSAALETFAAICTQLLDSPRVPMTVVTDQRHHLDARFQSVVGEFLDHVPFLFDTALPVSRNLDAIMETAQAAASANVNFLKLAAGDLDGAWRELGEWLFAGGAHLRLLRFNFQGEDDGFTPEAAVPGASDEPAHLAQEISGVLCDVTWRDTTLYFAFETNIAALEPLLSGLMNRNEGEATDNMTTAEWK